MHPEFRLGEWLVHPQLNLLTLGDKTVGVEPKVMDVLVYLAENAGEVLPKERLIKAVWSDAFVGDEVLTYSISELRKALSDDARNPRFIQTIPRRGYRLIAPVQMLQQQRRFRIVKRLGQGAMGEVFLAEDTLLRRKVALKFPLLDSERKEEQQKLILREARAAAALDHPFVCKIYDTGDLDGRFYLAMEYVRGQTLEAKLSRESISWPECLKIARAIAAALEFAHQHGVVHRDVKPSNIIISEQGHVKVTDFGVARRVPVGGEQQDWTVTLTSEVSATGTIPYMSPEQVSGSKVDARSDIFSFGVLLYEMLTGENPFRRDTPIETAAAILQVAAPALPADLSGSEPRLSGALEKMLAKEPSERYQAMSEVRAAFQELEKSPDQALPNSSPLPELPERGLAERDSAPIDTSRLSARLRLRRIARPLLAILVLATSAWAFWWFGFREASSPVGPGDVPIQLTPLTSDGGWKYAPALSPDGELIAFFWNGPSGDNFDLYVKPIDPDSAYLRLTSHPAPDSSGSWSPDGRRLAFIRTIGQRAAIYTIPALGGREEKIIEVQGLAPDFLGLDNPAPSWSPAGDWLAYAERPSEDEPFRVVLVDPETREKRVLTRPPASSGGDFNPSFSPDGRQLAFVRGSSGYANLDIWVQDLEGGEPRQITSENYQLCYGLSWRRNGEELLYTAGFQFKPRAYRVDLAEPVPRPVAGVGEGGSFTSVSGESLVYLRVYQPPPNLWRVPGRLAADRSVPPQELIRSSYPDLNASVSPDGGKIAFSSHRTGRPQIWVAARDGSNPRRITDVETEAGTPRWSPDGSRIVFDAVDSGNSDVYVVEVDGGSALRLTDHPSDDMVGTFSRNGRWIYFVSLRSGTSQIWKLPAQGGEAVQITHQGGGYALESWDGNYLYYAHAPEGQSQLSGQKLSLRRVPVGGGEEADVLSHLEDWTCWDLAPAGIYYSSRTWTRAPAGTPGPGYAQDFRVNYVDLETGKTTEIFSEVGPYNHWFLAVSPDEEWVLFSRFPVAESDLMLVKNFH